MYIIVFFPSFLTNMFIFLFFTFFLIHYVDLEDCCPSRVNCVVGCSLVLFAPPHFSCYSFTVWYYK
jgi:hypothetical protein